MDEIMLCKRIKYAGDVYKALLELEWDIDTAAAFLDSIPDVPITEYAPVVHGHWVDGIKCSRCGQVDCSRPSYCSTCGAIMDGKDCRDEHIHL